MLYSSINFLAYIALYLVYDLSIHLRFCLFSQCAGTPAILLLLVTTDPKKANQSVWQAQLLEFNPKMSCFTGHKSRKSQKMRKKKEDHEQRASVLCTAVSGFFGVLPYGILWVQSSHPRHRHPYHSHLSRDGSATGHALAGKRRSLR